MKNIVWSILLVTGMFLHIQCNDAPKTFKVQFDDTKEVSGQKFAIKDINPGLPRNWDEYNWVVLEFRISTAQRFQVGFTTDYGYNDLRVMSYVPNAWNKIALPLKFYRELPDAAVDIAATFNQPRSMGWINLGGKRGELHGVDSIGIRMRAPIGNPTFELRSLTLAVDDPGDEYLETTPAVDEFGQSNLVDYEGKAYSLEQLQAEWKAEDEEIVTTADYNYSKFGGYKQKQVKATGFFRIEKIDGCWWFVDPEGYLFLSVGVDCVHPGSGGNAKWVNERRALYKELPPAELNTNSRNGRVDTNSASFGNWNLFRRYGEDYPQKSRELVIKRMDKWGLNTIANWSSMDVINMNQKAFMIPLHGLGMQWDLMGLTDIYDPQMNSQIDKAIKDFVTPYKDNPWLIGYFVGNEPAWLEQEARLCGMILDGPDRPIKTALQKYLATGDTPEKRKEFIYTTFETFLQTVKKTMHKYDPNHLNLGIRFGDIDELDEDLLMICKRAFDVFSFNCYDLYPSHKMMDRFIRIADMPLVIGEYHFGAPDRGMAQSLWQVDNQKERGVAYRYYTENAYSHPGLIGTGYFQWGDQDLTGRGHDGENYNCGIVDVTDRPYKYMVEAMSETAKRLYEVHTGQLAPLSEGAKRPRGHEQIPDLWNQ